MYIKECVRKTQDSEEVVSGNHRVGVNYSNWLGHTTVNNKGEI